jgi:iron complex outermembrane receptor protein
MYCGYVNSQIIEGRIINAANSSPVENANMQHRASGENAVSNEQGIFRININNFPAILDISAIGFENKEVSVPGPGEFVNIYLIPSLESLSEVIIRSTLIPTELRKIPAAVNVISQADLQRIDPSNFAQVFNNVPGIYVNQGALNTTKLNIRGIGARSQYSTNRIQAYFEGIPLTTAEGEVTLDDFDPEGLSRIEIIKGPTSSIFGAGLGGVINLYAAQAAAGETKASVKGMVGSYNLLRKTISASHGSESTSLFINFNDVNTDGYRENGEYDRQSLLINTTLSTMGGNKMSFLANFTRLKAFIPSSVNEDDFLNNPKAANGNWARSRGFESYDRALFGISYHHKFSENFTNLTSVYLNFRDAYEPRPFNILKEERVSAGARTKFNVNTSIFTLPSQMSFGAEYYREWYETGTFENLFRQFENQGSVLGERLSNNEQDRNYTNVFALLLMEISEKLRIETGINLNATQYGLKDLFVQDDIDQSGDYRFKSIISPRLGLTYEINERKNFYASVSHGFSTPTVAETLTPEGQINTNLLPETGINYEVGFKGNWLRNQFYTEVALYSIQIEDLLVAQRVAEDRYVGINAGKTSHNGVEFLLNYSFFLFSELQLRPYLNGSLNYFKFEEFTNRDQDFEGNKLPGVPQSTVNIGFDLQFRNFSFYSNLLAVGEIPLNDENSGFAEKYELVNLKAAYQFQILKDFEVQFSTGVNNLFDEKYAASILTNAVGFGGAAPRFYYPGNPRNYYAGLSLNFQF